MRESRTYGFVRGAHSDMRPYRDLYLPAHVFVVSHSFLTAFAGKLTKSCICCCERPIWKRWL